MPRTRTGDFDAYLLESTIVSAQIDARWVSVVWEDGRASRFHHVWLRDNCPCGACVAEATREQTFELITVPAGDLVPVSVASTGSSLSLTWTGGHPSVYDAGWLRAHDYSTAPVHGREPARVLWDSSLGGPPTFDGAAVHAGDEDELFAWLTAMESRGCSLLHGVPATETAVGEVAARIGIVRETNFGVLWDVKVDDDPVSNANTALPLPLHTDLPTREYQPGLQFLHCLVNEAVGAAYRTLSEMTTDPSLQIRFQSRPRGPDGLRQPSGAARPRRLRPGRPSPAAGLLRRTRRASVPPAHARPGPAGGAAALLAGRPGHQRAVSLAGLRNTRPVGASLPAGSSESPGWASIRAPMRSAASARARCMPMQACGPVAKATWR